MELLGGFGSFEATMDVASSGMTAQTTRLAAVASNMANEAVVTGKKNKVYRSKNPIFASTMQKYRKGHLYDESESEGLSGVSVTGIVEKQGEPEREYNPGHPEADEEGFIYRSVVNMMEEVTNMVSAEKAYQANVAVVELSKNLALATIKIGQ